MERWKANFKLGDNTYIHTYNRSAILELLLFVAKNILNEKQYLSLLE